jgi:hypothetical protein
MYYATIQCDMQVSQAALDEHTLEPPERSPFGAESISIRNYDTAVGHEPTVTVTDGSGTVFFDRPVPVDPLKTVSIQTQLNRGVYDVTVTAEDATSISAKCLLGDAPGECAVIELGNGTATVTDGHW